ncbi:MAG: PQQ-binding-like beta-propeller repeat protein [Candidatus Bathyarchaeota archaeon]|nr:PQQ-binding-like beta-propeller repeat protein [Candidatus Bathyarchaeota archaeon]
MLSLQANSTGAQLSTSNGSSSTNLNRYEWPQFQGDSSFSRFSDGPAPASFNVLWKTNITGIEPYLVAFDGLIFVCTTHGVAAVNQEGEVVWQKEVPMTGTWPVPYKVDSSHLVVESSCLDPHTGNILWTSSDFTADTGPLFIANVYSPEERMFYTKVGSYVYAWDFSNPDVPPTLAWKAYVAGGGSTGSGVTYGGGLVFPGSFENHQVALDAKTGNVVWDTLTKGPMIFSGSYYMGRFLRGGTDDNTFYCFNATNGEVLWTYTPPDSDGYFCVGTAVGYGMVYSLNKDGKLYAFDVESGKLVWNYSGPGPLMFPGYPTVADGKVYATTGQNAYYNQEVGASEFACLDAYTGAVIWRLPMEALAPKESVIVAYGRLFMIPGEVTKAVDTISGNEYSTVNQLWAVGTDSVDVSNWHMWGADPTHSSAATAGPANLTLAWKFTTGGSVISSPTIVDGIVYFGSQDKNIYAVGAWSGKLIWRFTTGAFVESSVAVVNGKVYTGGDDGNVYCLDAHTGKLLWQTPINGNKEFTFATIVLKSSPTVSDGIVYIGSLDSNFYALDADSGRVVWKIATVGPIECSPAVSNGAVFFTSQGPTTGVLYKLDAKTGSVIWKQDIPYVPVFIGGTELLGSPSVADGMVFVPSNTAAYYALSEATGEVLWTFSNPSAGEFLFCSPIYVDGKVFLIDKFDVACINATTGKKMWGFYTGDELYVAPTYADDKIYDVTSQRHVFVLDATNNGSKLDVADMPSSSWSSPTIANNMLYIGCNDWNLYAFRENITNPESSAGSTSSSATLTPTMSTLIAITGAVAIAVAAAITYMFWRKNSKSFQLNKNQ